MLSSSSGHCRADGKDRHSIKREGGDRFFGFKSKMFKENIVYTDQTAAFSISVFPCGSGQTKEGTQKSNATTPSISNQLVPNSFIPCYIRLQLQYGHCNTDGRVGG